MSALLKSGSLPLVALLFASSGCVAEDDTSRSIESFSAGGTYRLMSVNSGLALDVSGRSTEDGAPVWQWPQTGGTNQEWRLQDAGGGTFELVSVNSGKCLEISGLSRAEGAAAQQWGCWKGANQRWRLVAAGGGAYTLVSLNSGMCLDVSDVSKSAGARVQQWKCWSGPNQKWKLVSVGNSGGGAAAAFVKASGRSFTLDGRPLRLIGANRYDVTSFPPGSGKFSCGTSYSDAQIDQLMSELVSATKANVLRLWAFQSFTLGGSDFSMLDRAIAKARSHGLKVIFTLENEWQDCTQPDPSSADKRKSGNWYASGYRAPLGNYPLSYRDYVRLVVERYANEPTIAMWQLMNEAESSDESALLSFTKDMSALIKSIDAQHLVSLGTIGGGQAGTANGAYRTLHEVAGIDVVEAHDYNSEKVALPGSPNATANSIYSDLQDAKALDKPFFIGEAGIAAPAPTYAFSYAERATYMDEKLAANFDAGAAGFLAWSFYDLKSDDLQGWDFNGKDPLAPVLARYHMAP